MKEETRNKGAKCDGAEAHKEENTMGIVSRVAGMKQNTATSFTARSWLVKKAKRSRSVSLSIDKYAQFGSTTQYERKIIDSLRADGLSDEEIGRCLKEF